MRYAKKCFRYAPQHTMVWYRTIVTIPLQREKQSLPQITSYRKCVLCLTCRQMPLAYRSIIWCMVWYHTYRYAFFCPLPVLCESCLQCNLYIDVLLLLRIHLIAIHKQECILWNSFLIKNAKECDQHVVNFCLISRYGNFLEGVVL